MSKSPSNRGPACSRRQTAATRPSMASSRRSLAAQRPALDPLDDQRLVLGQVVDHRRGGTAGRGAQRVGVLGVAVDGQQVAVRAGQPHDHGPVGVATLKLKLVSPPSSGAARCAARRPASGRSAQRGVQPVEDVRRTAPARSRPRCRSRDANLLAQPLERSRPKQVASRSLRTCLSSRRADRCRRPRRWSSSVAAWAAPASPTTWPSSARPTSCSSTAPSSPAGRRSTPPGWSGSCAPTRR